MGAVVTCPCARHGPRIKPLGFTKRPGRGFCGDSGVSLAGWGTRGPGSQHSRARGRQAEFCRGLAVPSFLAPPLTLRFGPLWQKSDSSQVAVP